MTFLALVLFLPFPSGQVPQASQILDANGKPISSVFVENRVIIPSEDIPLSLKKAVVAVEDKRFYLHRGIDLGSLARALWRDIKERAWLEGGSTITQQLAKNLFLTQEKTLSRKFIEAAYTVKLEMRYSKDEILSMYLNQIYWGHGTWGCEVASLTYFGSGAKTLSLPESALLAGIIRSPEYYSPYYDLDRAKQRRDLVLDLMEQQGYITPNQNDSAKELPVDVASLPVSRAPYFVSYVLHLLESRHPEIRAGIARGGYKIYTTLDLDMQTAAETAFSAYMPEGSKDEQGITQPQGALIALEPRTGYIKAMIGGRDWDETQLNRTWQVTRQPGSAFKVFLYAAVIDKGHPLTETRWCEPTTFPGARPGEVYRPVDSTDKPYHYQQLNIRQAIAISDNVVAAKWAGEIGPSTIIDYARSMGITSPLEDSIPLALGASAVIPIDMAVGAATLAAGGVRPEPLAILKVVDAKGRVIEENKVKKVPVLDAGTCYVLTSALRSVLGQYGTGAGLQGWLGSRPAAAKSGTSDDRLEAWFFGYTRDLACAVYVGYDHRERSLPGTGASVAGPIWASFMADASRQIPVQDFEIPPSVTWAEVCDATGLLAGPNCPARHYEVFLRYTLPPMHTVLPGPYWPRSEVPEALTAENVVPLIPPVESIPGWLILGSSGLDYGGLEDIGLDGAGANRDGRDNSELEDGGLEGIGPGGAGAEKSGRDDEGRDHDGGDPGSDGNIRNNGPPEEVVSEEILLEEAILEPLPALPR